MSASLKLVETLYETNAADIAAMLRQAAGNIETESEDDDRTKSVIAVQLHESGLVQVYGWGSTDTVHAIGALNLGAARLARDMLEGGK